MEIDYEEDEDTQDACPSLQEQLISMWEDEYFEELTQTYEWKDLK